MLSPIRFKERYSRNFPMKPRLLHIWNRFRVESHGVSMLGPGNVRRHCCFESRLAELLEYSGAKQAVLEGRGAERDHWVFVCALVAIGVCARHPQRKQPENTSRLLEPGQPLPLAFKD